MKNYIRILLIGVIMIGITLTIVYTNCEYHKNLTRFYTFIGPILLSEIIITLTTLQVVRRRAFQSFPLTLGSVIIPWIYFFITLCMTIVFYSSICDISFILIQVSTLFLFLIIFTCVEMGKESIEIINIKNPDFKNIYRIKLAEVVQRLKTKFEDPKTQQEISLFQDKISFPHSSVLGKEIYDEKILREISNFSSHIEILTENECKMQIQKIYLLFLERESNLK